MCTYTYIYRAICVYIYLSIYLSLSLYTYIYIYIYTHNMQHILINLSGPHKFVEETHDAPRSLRAASHRRPCSHGTRATTFIL